ncbi:hypothetical protein B0O99DRAFT_644048, partial [Bisporella sp. PMI_857]
MSPTTNRNQIWPPFNHTTFGYSPESCRQFHLRASKLQTTGNSVCSDLGFAIIMSPRATINTTIIPTAQPKELQIGTAVPERVPDVGAVVVTRYA